MSRSLHWSEIERLVLAHHREDPASSVGALERYLRKWWCITYNRPFKDPLLEAYSLDELVYEFLSKHFLKPENDPDKLEAAKKAAQEDEEWAARMVEQELKKMEENTKKLESTVKKAAKKLGKSTKSRKKSVKTGPGLKDLPDVISTKFNLPEE